MKSEERRVNSEQLGVLGGIFWKREFIPGPGEAGTVGYGIRCLDARIDPRFRG